MGKPDLHTIASGDVEIAVWEWNAEAKGQEESLIFAHATGFHGRVFDAIIEHLPNRHILSVELHGHGRSTGGPVTHWKNVTGQVADALAHFAVAGAHGIGHSWGGHILLQVAADNPAFFSRLTLFDPVVLDPQWYEAAREGFDGSEPHPSIKRKRNFASAEAMFERFKDREPYSLFTPHVLRDYCDYGVLTSADAEGVELACLPEVEASVYGSSRSNTGIIEAARHVDIPVRVVRAKRTQLHDFKSSPTWPDLASILPKGEDMLREDMTHFHPFQDPADAARIIGLS